MRYECTLASNATRFVQAAIALGDLSDLAGQSDLAERDGIVRKWFSSPGRNHRQSDGQIARRFGCSDPSNGRHVYIVSAKRHAAATLQDRDEQRKTGRVHPDGGAPGHRTGICRLDERLHLAYEGPAAFYACGEHRTGVADMPIGKKESACVSYGQETVRSHVEEPGFLRRSEPVLQSAKHAHSARAITLEIQDDIDEVFEYAGSGYYSFFGDMTDEDYGHAVVARRANQTCAAFADLRNRTGGRRYLGIEDRLDRIDDDDGRARSLYRTKHGGKLRIGERAHTFRYRAEPQRARLHLLRRFFPTHQEHLARGAERHGDLKAERRLADARLAGQQYDPRRHDAASKNAVNLVDPRRDPIGCGVVLHSQWLRRNFLYGKGGRCDALFNDRAELTAVRAPSDPPRHPSAARLAGGLDLGFHHPASLGTTGDRPGAFWDTVLRHLPGGSMRKQMLVAVIALGFVLVACGREGGDVSQLTQSTATPRATATAAATATPAASATPEATAAGTAAPAATQAPAGEVPQATAGQVNRPKAGRYVYDLSGEGKGPFDPSPRPIPSGAQTTTRISRNGDINTDETTSSQEAGRIVAKTRWEPSKVSLISYTLESSGRTFACTFNPPVVILNIPIKAETFPTQNLNGEGNACGGTLDITVEGKENVKDATGRTWSTWRVKVRQQVKNTQLETMMDDTRWVSPDLGTTIRTQSNQNGSSQGVTFSSKTTSVLRSHP